MHFLAGSKYANCRRLSIAAGFLLLGALNGFAGNPGDLLGGGLSGMSPTAIFFAIAAATLVSEDLAAISAGVLASQGVIGFPLAVASAATGILIGDILLFLAGRFIGRPALGLPLIGYFVTESAIERSSHWLRRRGMAAIFISRFVFGLRLPLYFAAGVLRTSFWKFTLYFSLAVAIWTPVLVGASYWLGERIVKDSLVNRYSGLAVAGIILALFLIVRLIQQLTTWKGRRILLGKLRRRFIWEFWSIRVFYAPVVLKIAALAVRYRSLTVFTCANPGIPGGGFVGESKEAILRMIDGSPAADGFVLRHQLLSGVDKLDAARSFVERNQLEFPVVVKPDAGERGLGVRIVRSGPELESAVDSASELIIQEFAPGEEASVFYFRNPGSERGEIFAITEKRFPTVMGDGESTVEELILGDERAICLAKSYLEQNRERLDDIPPAGEILRIIDIGTHSRGAIFLDGSRFKTPELERRIDEICSGIDGFWFGRFDMRVESFEAFSRGERFKIVELNGVTSEATNIYDPKFSLIDAYRILFRQWEIAFEIGKLNRLEGARETTVRELVSMYFRRPN
jgi:membrane protein DedA with SNARE-associated domain